MLTVLIISMIIIFVVLLLAVLTTSKAYKYEHKVDSLDDNPHLQEKTDEHDPKK